ncbi:hypothetical protein RQP46_011515 [Phenoliferia psychrophenolica]
MSRGLGLGQKAADTLNSSTKSIGVADSGREAIGDKVSAAVTPDSSKSYTESATDFVKGKVDAAASYVEPDVRKGLDQKAADTLDSSTKSIGVADSGREAIGDKVSAAVTPDSSKSYTESATDFVKGKVDAAASYVEPDGRKGLGQKAADTLDSSTKSIGVADSGREAVGDKTNLLHLLQMQRPPRILLSRRQKLPVSW